MGLVAPHEAPLEAPAASMGHGDTRRQREAFLARTGGAPLVRPEVLASWRRSCGHGVDPDTVDVPVAEGADRSDRDELVVRTALPVLSTLARRLDTTRTALLLASPRARIVARWAGDRAVLTALDRLHSVPGGSLAEEHVGTNGLGTPLVVDRPLVVSGAEHFARPYLGFTCAGAPLHHPADGELAGGVVLVGRTADANGLMLALVLDAVKQIQDGLVADHSGERPSGAPRPSRALGAPRPLRAPRPLEAPRPATRSAAPASAPESVADRSAGHRRPADQVAGVEHFRWPVLVEGEAGTGKLHLVETMWDHAGHGGRPTVLDAALTPLDGAADFLQRLRAALAGDGLVVLRHVELLSAVAARAAAALLDERLEPCFVGPGARPETARVAGTLTRGWSTGDGGVQALIDRLGMVGLVVPPLRERRQEVPALVDATMRSAGLIRPWSPAALAALQRGDWPGNVRQLRNVVLAVGSAPTADPVTVDELPAELAPGPTRHQLSRMEAIERAAIIADLRAADGNKREAARRLGVSRSTLYRKLRAYEVG